MKKNRNNNPMKKKKPKKKKTEVNDPIYPTPPLRQDMTHGQFLSGV